MASFLEFVGALGSPTEPVEDINEQLKEQGRTQNQLLQSINQGIEELKNVFEQSGQEVQKSIEQQIQAASTEAEQVRKMYSDITSGSGRPNVMPAGMAVTGVTAKGLALVENVSTVMKDSSRQMIASQNGVMKVTTELNKKMTQMGKSLDGASEAIGTQQMQTPPPTTVVDIAGGKGGGGGKGGKGGGPPLGSGGSGDKDAEKALQNRQRGIARTITITDTMLNKLYRGISGFMAAISAGITLKDIFSFKDIATDLKFAQEIGSIALQTGKIVGLNREVQSQYEDIARFTALTGKRSDVYQKSLAKNLKRGNKELKVAQDVTTSALNAATMLGMDADTTADTFGTWNLEMGFGSTQLHAMSTDLRYIAKSTGVTGDNLADAVKSSEKFVKSMRNAGTLTEGAAANIIEIQARAKKLGIEDAVSPLLQALSNTNALYNDVSEKTRSLLFQAGATIGRLSEVQSGTILQTRQGIKEMSQGLSMVFSRYAGMSMEDFFKLDAEGMISDEFKRDLNLRLKAGTNMEIKELELVNQELNEAGKGYADKIKDIDKALKDQVLTEKERVNLLDQQKSMKFDVAMKGVARFNEALKDPKGLSSLDFSSKKLKDLGTDLRSVAGIEAGKDVKSVDLMRSVAMEGAKGLTEAAQEVNKSLPKKLQLDTPNWQKMLQEASTDKELREVFSKMETAQQEIGRAQVTGLTPAEQTAQAVREINSWLRGEANQHIMKLLTYLGPSGVIAAGIGSSLAAGATGFLTVKNLSAIFGKFGKKAPVAGTVAKSNKGIITSIAQTIAQKFQGTKTSKMLRQGKKAVNKGALGAARIMERVPGAGAVFSKNVNALTKKISIARPQLPTQQARGKALSLISQSSSKSFGILGKSFSILGKSITKSITKIVTGPIGWLTVGFSALDGAATAGANAAEFLGVKQSELTKTQIAAAEGAGFLTGILDTLTFGIFTKWLGGQSALTGMLTRFIEKSAILNAVLSVVVDTFKAAWAIIKGLGIIVWETVKGIWSAIKSIAAPFMQLWTDINDAIMSAITPLGDVFASLGEILSPILTPMASAIEAITGIDLTGTAGGIKSIGDAIGLIVPIMTYVGKIIGGVIAAIAKAVGTIISVITIPLGFIIKLVGSTIGVLVKLFAEGLRLVLKPIQWFLSGVMKIFSGLYETLAGLFTLDLGRMASGIGTIILGIFQSLGSTILAILTGAFLGLGGYLLTGFVSLGSVVLTGLTGLLSYTFSGLTDLLTTWVYDPFVNVLSGIGDLFTTYFTDPLKNALIYLMDSVIPDFMQPQWLTDMVTEANKQNGSTQPGANGKVPTPPTAQTQDQTWGEWTKSWIPGFAEGTKLVQQGGLAMLHPGESVVPSNAVNAAAIGNGPFGPYAANDNRAFIPESKMPKQDKLYANLPKSIEANLTIDDKSVKKAVKKTSSLTDEILGLSGATATGALAGFAVGSFVPFIGPAIGTAIGGALGFGSEIYNMITDEGSIIGGALRSVGSRVEGWASSAAGWFSNKLSEAGTAISETIQGTGILIAEAASRLWEGAKSAGSAIWEGTKNAGSWLWNKAKEMGTAASNLPGAQTAMRVADVATLPVRHVAKTAAIPIKMAAKGVQAGYRALSEEKNVSQAPKQKLSSDQAYSKIIKDQNDQRINDMKSRAAQLQAAGLTKGRFINGKLVMPGSPEDVLAEQTSKAMGNNRITDAATQAGFVKQMQTPKQKLSSDQVYSKIIKDQNDRRINDMKSRAAQLQAAGLTKGRFINGKLVMPGSPEDVLAEQTSKAMGNNRITDAATQAGFVKQMQTPKNEYKKVFGRNDQRINDMKSRAAQLKAAGLTKGRFINGKLVMPGSPEDTLAEQTSKAMGNNRIIDAATQAGFVDKQVQGIVSTDGGEATTVMAQTALPNVKDDLERERASESPAAGSMMGVDELSLISNVSQLQLSQLIQIANGINQLVATLSADLAGDTRGFVSGDTIGESKPANSRDYGKWQQGFHQIATQQVQPQST